jgi:hypothetical protein
MAQTGHDGHGAFGRSGPAQAGAINSPTKATDEEIKETVAMAVIVRHRSTLLNGSQVDLATFKQQTDQVFAAVKAKSQ